MTTMINIHGEFVTAEPPSAYPQLAAIDPREAIRGWCKSQRAEHSKVCPNCGQPFTTAYKSKTYCSTKCSDAAHRRAAMLRKANR